LEGTGEIVERQWKNNNGDRGDSLKDNGEIVECVERVEIQ